MTEERWVDITEIKLWNDNPNEGDVGAIITAIEEYGFNGYVALWQDNTCFKGNHTMMALYSLKSSGWEPFGDGLRVKNKTWEIRWIDISHLPKVKAKAFGIADNKLTRLGRDDIRKVSELLVEIHQEDQDAFDATGYSREELDDLLKMIRPPTLDSLKDEYGESLPDDFYPVIRAQVPPDIYERFLQITIEFGDNEQSKVIGLINAYAGVLGENLSS